MDEATRALVVLSAAIGSGERSAVDAALDGAGEAAAPEAIEEALLQSYLFVGFPGALNAMAAWRERTGQPAGRAAAGGSREEWRARGEAVCARVYGTQYARLRERVAELHPDLEAWMLEEGYGKVLARPGLALSVRELCIVALLVAQDAPAQLHAHLRGALNVGASVEDVAEAVEIACAAAPPARAQAARGVWAAVRARWEGRASSGAGAAGRAGA
ncbi:MAG TPA: carboxymuconolactone decarboxylase family protein [Longimicrobiales bacterium]